MKHFFGGLTMKRYSMVVFVVLFALGMPLTAWSASESAAQQMLDSVPADTFFCVATSGGDAVAPAFRESSLGRIWHDPGVQQFVNDVKLGLLEALTKHAGPDVPVQDIQTLVRQIVQCPMAAGVRGADGPDKVSLSGFVFVKAGDKKASVAALIEKFEALAGEGNIVTRRVARIEMHAPKAQDDVPLCWGWEDDVLVLLINDDRGVALRSLRRAGRRPVPTQVPAGLANHGDLVLLTCDLQKAIALVERGVAAEDPDAAAIVKRVLGKLGLTGMRTLAARAGFQGRNLIVDELVAMSEPPAGLLAAAGPIDVSRFDAVEAAAVSAMACNLDVPAIYDTIMGIIESESPKAAEEANGQISALEQMTGVSIRAGLIRNIAGPMIVYKLPAYQIPQAPNGGWVLMVDVKDSAALASTLGALGTFAEGKSNGMLQVGTQKTAKGETINTWVIAPLAMMQLMPAWIIEDKTLIVGTQPALVERAIGQLKAADPKAGSIRSREDFQALEARLPKQVLSLKFDDSQSEIRTLRMQIQQYWPMLTMAASSKGVRLPVMLPDIEAAIKDMPASCEYTWREGNDIRGHYHGCGFQSSNVGAGGIAMGAAILMPALSRTKKISQRVVAGTNLKGIGTACHVYAQDHDGKFPPTLETLCETVDVSPKSLESPRKPKDFDGPSFIYIAGQTIHSPSMNILAYENPDFISDDKINVLYVDGHVSAESRQELEKQLEVTRKALEQKEKSTI